MHGKTLWLFVITFQKTAKQGKLEPASARSKVIVHRDLLDLQEMQALMANLVLQENQVPKVNRELAMHVQHQRQEDADNAHLDQKDRTVKLAHLGQLV